MNTAQSAGRHPSVTGLMRWFTYDHLTNPDDRQVSASFARLATELVNRIRTDDPELAVALRKLLEAKDAAVRANIVQRQPPPQPQDFV